MRKSNGENRGTVSTPAECTSTMAPLSSSRRRTATTRVYSFSKRVLTIPTRTSFPCPPCRRTWSCSTTSEIGTGRETTQRTSGPCTRVVTCSRPPTSWSSRPIRSGRQSTSARRRRSSKLEQPPLSNLRLNSSRLNSSTHSSSSRFSRTQPSPLRPRRKIPPQYAQQGPPMQQQQYAQQAPQQYAQQAQPVQQYAQQGPPMQQYAQQGPPMQQQQYAQQAPQQYAQQDPYAQQAQMQQGSSSLRTRS